jgi:hypothetical protein
MIRKDVTRFWEIVDRSQDGCWPYPDATFPIGANDMPVQRFAWEAVRGPISKWDAVRATCGNDRCVRPAHLELQRMGRFVSNGALAIRVRERAR